MFAARGLAVSMSVFVIVYGLLSLAVGFTWRKVSRYGQRRPARWIANLRFANPWNANLLFALRMSPLAAAAGITIAVTVPSFLWLEPRAIDERTGGIALLLSLCGGGLGMLGVLNMGTAILRAARAISQWTHAAQPVRVTGTLPVLRISRPVPGLVTAGIVRPRILLSGAAESGLTAAELQAALNHEVAHVRQRDNLKRLLLRLVPFPGLDELEAAWAEAAEMAADEGAVSNPAEALDLAAALIKLSRLAPVCPPADLTAALLPGQGPASAVGARVERLLAWNGGRSQPPQKYSPWYGLAAAVATFAVFSVTYSQLLVHVHTATEWLVR
jgi:hypothetical protein